MNDNLQFTVALVTLLGGMLAIAFKMWAMVSHFSKIELKVETLWDFLMRRSLAQGLDAGVITMNSPVVATAPLEHLLEPFAQDLEDFYRLKGKTMTDREMFFEISRQFGQRMMKEICLPHKIHEGAAIFAAIDIAKKRGAK